MIVIKHFYKRKCRTLLSSPSAETSVPKNLMGSASKDSITIEISEELKGSPSTARDHSPMAPLARPESSIDDSDIEECVTSRVSSTWKDFNLTAVLQSTDSLTTPRGCATTDVHPLSPITSSITLNPTSSYSSIPSEFISSNSLYASKIAPPPKPPRTFAADKYRGVPVMVIKPPPKPPRTYAYAKVNSCSLDWDFPHYRPLASSPHKRSQSSLPSDYSDPGRKNFVGDTDFVDGRSPTFDNSEGSFSYSVLDTKVTYLQERSSFTALTNGLEGSNPVYATNVVYGKKPIYGTRVIRGEKAVNGNSADDAHFVCTKNPLDVRNHVNGVKTVCDTSPVTKPTLSGSHSLFTSDQKLTSHSIPENQLQFEQRSSSLSTSTDVHSKLAVVPGGFTGDQVVTRRGRGNRSRNKRHAIYFDSDDSSNLLQFTCSCSDIPEQPAITRRPERMDNGFLETLL